MKKIFSYLFILALGLSASVSCTEEIQSNRLEPGHTVFFSTADQSTRTGLSIEDNYVIPDWRKTDPTNVHLFELGSNQTVVGETVGMSLSDDSRTAHFQATFPNGPTAPYKYAAVVAPKPDEALNFVIPTEQHPDATTLKDPDADFLIGYSRKSYTESVASGDNVVDLYFNRVATLARLGISNFKGSDEKVKSVTINASEGLVGAASYPNDIDFENASVRFVRDEGPGILTLSYGKGVAVPEDGTFYAYFVTIPGTVPFTSIEVVTDQYRYVRDIAGGKEYTFTNESLKTINLNLGNATAETVEPDPATYTKVTTLTVGGTYLIVDADDNLIFKGNINGSSQSVTPVNGVITDDANGTLAAYEFTVEQNSSDYYLKFNDGKYLVSNWNSPGNGSTGLCYVDTQAEVKYPYALTTDNGAFMFSTTQVNSSTSTNQVLYYKTSESVFKIGGSGRGVGIHLYLKGGLQDRGLKFEPESVTCLQGETPEMPVLSGTYTTVRYTSDNTSVATVDLTNGTVTVLGIGTATITATVDEDDDYLAGTASYTLTVLDSSTASYVKATAITVGGTYLIVDVADQRLFKGATDGSYLTVSPENGIIIDYDRTLSAYEFTVEQNGSNYYLKFNDGKYLVCDYGTANGGNSTTGLRYVATQAQATFPYALTVNDGAFEFNTTQMTTTTSTNQVLYYKPSGSGSGTDRFKIGGSGLNVGVHLYMKGGKKDRGLKFEPTSVTCLQGNTPEKPVLSGTYTTVNYSSDNTSVATVNATDGTVTVTGVGTAIITATVEADDDYLAGTASYTLTVMDPNGSSYTKVTTLTVGGTYLIVDADDNLIFKGNINGSSQSVTPVNGVITDDANGTLAAYEFTVEQNGSDYYLKFNDGKYLVSNWNSPGNGSTGLCYVNTQAEVKYPYALTTDNGAFMFSTTQVNSSTSTNQVLYYKTSESVFKIGGSGRGVGIHLYLKGGGGSSTGQQVQTLRFDPTSVTCTLDGSFTQPTLSGVKTTVQYTSSDPDVASVDQNSGAVKRNKLGTTIITATAVENEQYLAGVASYTLYIVEPPSGEWKDLGTISLENKAVSDYLTAANNQYTDTNENTTTIVSSYVNGSQYSSISRKDCPAPVTITWTNSATSSTKVTIYQDEALTQEVWSQNATSDSKSADVYNLIPGIKYYYTVSDNGTIWEKGYFNTSGRRRMIRVSGTSSTDRANNCRDLGGMITKDGTKRIKYGYIFRGSNMNSTTSTEKDILTNYLKIKMDIDLRVSSSSPWGNSSQNASRVFSASTYPEIGYLNRGFDGYSDLASDDGLARVGDIITTIMDTVLEGKAVYFHCYVGADRTGIIGVMLEGLLGISEKDCSIDYELTSFCTAVGMRPRDGSQNDHYFSKGLKLLRDQEGETFQDKCNAFLTSKKVGVSQTKIDQFKNFILGNNN